MVAKHKQPSLVTDLRPSAQNQSTRKRGGKLLNANLKLVIGGILAIGLIVLIYGYAHTKHQLDQLSAGSKNSGQNPTQKTIDQIGQLVQLPTSETPTLATVDNASRLKNQPFFEPAKDGDKVLIYSKAGWALIYRPSINRVIEYSKVNLNSNQ